ncbi:MAG: class I adenylate-forming enzyme family protein [Sphingobium sp.]
MMNEALRHAAKVHAKRPAILSGEGELSFADLFARSCRLANLLADAGVPAGSRIASLGVNGLTSLEELTAVALGNFVRSPLYMQDNSARQAYMMRRAGASALIVDADCWPALHAALEPEDVVRIKVVLVRRGHGPLPGGAVHYEEALAQASDRDPALPEDPDATYIVRFSAGTTGMPKPIAHSRRAYWFANEEVLSVTPPVRPDDVYLAVSPYSHGSGNLVWPFIAAGAAHAVMPGSFNPEVALERIQRHRCTTLFLVPTMIQRLISSPSCGTTDLSSIRRIIYGAAPIPQNLIRKALDTFGMVLAQSYGQSEIVPITSLRPDDHRPDDSGAWPYLTTAGRVTENSRVRIEDADGTILPTGQIGEVVGFGPGAMQCIYGDPEATAERITPDGWIRTRDLGWLDEQGYLHIVDRLDDMIISGGFNIAPSEIEDALNAHDDVVEAVAFGVPHPEWGATPMAVVRARAGSTVDVESLMAWSRARIGNLKKPTQIVLTDEPLPINAAGKLMRRVAKEKYGTRI